MLSGSARCGAVWIGEAVTVGVDAFWIGEAVTVGDGAVWVGGVRVLSGSARR